MTGTIFASLSRRPALHAAVTREHEAEQDVNRQDGVHDDESRTSERWIGVEEAMR